MSRLTDMRQQRLDKLARMREIGLDPFPAESHRSQLAATVVEEFEKFAEKKVTLAGRLMNFRDHGHLIFGDLVDYSGKIQLYIKDDTIDATNIKQQNIGFADLSLLDAGDIVEATGTVTKTQRGEISLLVEQLRILTKTLRPLPDSWDGLKDPEIMFRRRYLDLIINPERRALFERKAKFWQENRRFMHEHGFIEVETPVLEHVTGGADARPFTTHMNALDQDFFLRISTELYQKRLIGGGFEKVFTVGPNFRNEGLSDEHLPEYTQIEWYWAYADYRDNMKLVEEMFRHVAKAVYGTTKFTKNEHAFDLGAKWEEISYPDIIREKLGIDIFNDSDEKMEIKVRELKIKLDGLINRQRLIDNLWKSIRKTISGPAFLINEPKFMSPLAKSKLDNPDLTQRFHIIIAGSELGNGYSELNDPLDQLARFQDQQAARNNGDDEAQMMDIDFVEMLEYGMPPTSGYGHSERVFWFLENVTAREGTLFPQLKHKLEESTKEIYGIKEVAASKKQSEEEPTLNTCTPQPSQTAKTSSTLPSRADAIRLLETYIKNSALLHHCQTVAQAMEAYAEHLGEDTELWYQTGLLHDLDWEMFPDEHPNKAVSELLASYPQALKDAILAHAPSRTDKLPETTLERYLFACDELSGFLHAASLMRPNGFADMEVRSVKKKLKDKHFAANVSRKDIEEGLRLIDTSADEHIAFLIDVFQKK
jgi:lysyl-tRNA synthetase class 2